jgi:hypothetical protein
MADALLARSFQPVPPRPVGCAAPPGARAVVWAGGVSRAALVVCACLCVCVCAYVRPSLDLSPPLSLSVRVCLCLCLALSLSASLSLSLSAGRRASEPVGRAPDRADVAAPACGCIIVADGCLLTSLQLPFLYQISVRRALAAPMRALLQPRCCTAKHLLTPAISCCFFHLHAPHWPTGLRMRSSHVGARALDTCIDADRGWPAAASRCLACIALPSAWPAGWDDLHTMHTTRTGTHQRARCDPTYLSTWRTPCCCSPAPTGGRAERRRSHRAASHAASVDVSRMGMSLIPTLGHGAHNRSLPPCATSVQSGVHAHTAAWHEVPHKVPPPVWSILRRGWGRGWGKEGGWGRQRGPLGRGQPPPSRLLHRAIGRRQRRRRGQARQWRGHGRQGHPRRGWGDTHRHTRPHRHQRWRRQTHRRHRRSQWRWRRRRRQSGPRPLLLRLLQRWLRGHTGPHAQHDRRRRRGRECLLLLLLLLLWRRRRGRLGHGCDG